ncbi:MAG TPA: hypothetical protein PLU30_05535 [Verrucomicrobiae bacterium]|nr:hypothetical protein [Verrucomicrobiae bacterium]
MRVRVPKPAVPRSWLAVIAGLLWFAVGLMLDVRAVVWIRELRPLASVLALAAGLCFGLVMFLLVLTRIARKNLRRLASLPDQPCLFAFQGWHSYLIIAFMVTLGIALRHSSLPHAVLAATYLGVGTALIMASLLVYGDFCIRRRAS